MILNLLGKRSGRVRLLLRGNLAGHFRVRTGDYRVQFHLSGDTLIVEKVGHRDGFYE